MSFAHWKGILRRVGGKGTCPYQFSFLLDSPLRRFILSPQKLAGRLKLRPDLQVLEIGPGSGYFSVEVARRVSRGYLTLFDLQREMLTRARRKVEAAGLSNVGFIRGDAVCLPFGAETFDRVFLVAVLGEIPSPQSCLRGVYRILRPGGILSVTEQPGDPDFLPLGVVRSLAEEQGFRLVESFGGGRNFTANFSKPGE